MHRLRFAAELIGCAAVGGLAGVMFRHNDTLYFALFVVGIAACAAFLVHLFFGLRGPWRFHYVTINRFFTLILAALVCFTLFANLTNRTDQQAARTYLDQIKPRLDSYHENFGHYPDDLRDVADLPAPPPPGFLYRREKDPSDSADTYIIDYFSQEYSSASNRWSDDN